MSVLSARIAVQRRSGGFGLDVAFEAPPGITTLFGPSGAGKSTTLAALAGLIAPTTGKIQLGENTWLDTGAGIDAPPHRRHVGFVFQSLALFPHLTAVGNVAYGMDRALSRDERHARARELLERLGVAHLASRRPRTFSGGEAQRVALARMFATSPALVLLDEPFSALDDRLRRQLSAEVRSYVDERKIPALHVTHRLDEARELGDRAILLDAGRVAGVGTIDELARMR